MSTAIPDLWPSDIVSADEPSPASILRQQGYLLGQKTRNFVTGEVTSGGSPNEFTHEFWVSAPLLNVRVRLCSVQHGIRFYPTKVKTFQLGSATGSVSFQRAEHIAPDLASFTDIIKTVLAEGEIRELVQSLANQSRDLNGE